MPCTLAARHVSSVALASAVVALAVALACLAPSARGADTASKATPDPSVRITTSPPAIHVDTQAKKDESADDAGTTATKRGRARITIDGDDEDFDTAPWRFAQKAPWVVALIFLVVGSIFLTPLILLVGIIWYKLRKTRLQNDAMLRLAEKGVVSPAQAADALSAGASPASVAPQIYQQAVALRKRVMWSDLRKGVILSMLGAAFCLYWIIAGGEASWVGLILLFIGIAYLSLWWLEGRHLDQAGAGRIGNASHGAGGESSSVPGSSGP